jgi:hypothetical protein
MTMIGRFGNPWETAAGDGALSPVGIARPECDFDALMDAWSRERQDCIECRLHLDAAARLLRKILNEEAVPLRLRRRSKQLLLAIRAVHDAEGSGAPDED